MSTINQFHFCANKISHYSIQTINLVNHIVSIKCLSLCVYPHNDPHVFYIIVFTIVVKRYVFKIIFAQHQVGYLKKVPHILYTRLHRFRPIGRVPLFFLSAPRVFIVRWLLKPLYIDETLFVFAAPTIVVLKICFQ